jgi:cytochrome b subunit of formate dehydrogenase
MPIGRKRVFDRLNETVLKVIVIISILLMFIVLYTTGIAFMLGNFSTATLMFHKLAALIVIALLSVHAWLRRCSIRKLWQETIATVLNRHIRHEDNIDFLVHNTKNQSFQELCTLFNYDAASLQKTLLEHHVTVERFEDSLKTIAKRNDKDMFQILLLMMKLHVETNSASPIYDASCSRA